MSWKVLSIALSTRPNTALTSVNSTAKLPWKELITNGGAESTRATAKWLMMLAEQLDSPSIPVDVWQKLVTQERMLLESKRAWTVAVPHKNGR